MADGAARPLSLPDDWPAHPHLSLALNRMGTFDWDLDSGLMHLDESALAVFDLHPDEYDGRPGSLAARFPSGEGARMDNVVAQALENGSGTYGGYFRVRHRDGSLHWTHTQGRVRRDRSGRPRRVIGIIRDAEQELTASTTRLELDTDDRVRTSVVEATTAALAQASTVSDVLDVLNGSPGLKRLGATNLVMGLLEAGRIRMISNEVEGSLVPGMLYTRIDEEYPMSEVVRTLAPRFIESADEFSLSYPLLWPSISGFGITAAAYLPLIAQARPVGALGLLYADKSRFSPDERNLLVALGSSIAQSIQRAVLFEQEHDLAEGLQQAMLPRRIPAVPGAQIAVRYRPARIGREIGGDWYDIIQLPGDRVGAVIGDVQGHDTHAAAVMGQLRIVLRAYAAEGHSPATVMARTSVYLHELDTERFATCIYAETDLATGAVRMVRAGHVDPLIRDSDGTTRRLDVAGGLPLGPSAFFGRLDYPVKTFELGPGQTLVLYTDGLVERPDADLDEGIGALTTLVRDGPHDLQLLADRLVHILDEWGGEDDGAVLLLRRRGVAALEAGGRLRQLVERGDSEALRSARRMIRAAVGAWGDSRRADDIELVADELITNALKHTGGDTTLVVRVLSRSERRMRIEVDDRSSVLPSRSETGVSRRGLQLVNELADSWGVESRGRGKSVWCEFIIPHPPQADHSVINHT